MLSSPLAKFNADSMQCLEKGNLNECDEIRVPLVSGIDPLLELSAASIEPKNAPICVERAVVE
jgi:hypothetical protein